MATSTSDGAGALRCPRFYLIGGKGGVGKTTCAAAKAIALAARGARTLIVSTDPAPSLGDALQVHLRSDPRKIRVGRAILHAAEIDAPLVMRRWLRSRRRLLQTIAVRGTWLDERDVASLLGLSLPGVDEIAALLELLRVDRLGRYDAMVVDTAPTGHTLRMLALPEMLGGMARVFDHMQDKHRAMVEALRGGWQQDPADALIAELQADARELASLLRDPQRTELSWVTLAEEMASEETLDAIRQLRTTGIGVSRIIVNQVTALPPDPCRWCAARRRVESRVLSIFGRRLREAAGKGTRPVRITTVMAQEREPVGVRALRKIALEIETGAEIPAEQVRRPKQVWGTLSEFARTRGAVQPLDAGVRLAMFGGKGGVGKTTCAAAVALDVARRNPNTRLLLLSTDPAHSLADALGVTVSDVARSLPGGPSNLEVRELDPSRALDALRQQYGASIDAMFQRLSRGSSFDMAYDRRVMHDLLDLAPPGFDEVTAVLEVIDLIDRGDDARYDLVVMDTAPTGHALRLLQMPVLVQDWVRALMRILLKYQPVVGIGDLGAALLAISKGIGRLCDVLEDPRLTNFVVVTRTAALPTVETRRMLKALRRLRVHVSAIVVNELGKGDCSRCRRATKVEHRQLQRILSVATASRVGRVLVAPAALPPPHGAHRLTTWRARWLCLPAISSRPTWEKPRPTRTASSTAAGARR